MWLIFRDHYRFWIDRACYYLNSIPGRFTHYNFTGQFYLNIFYLYIYWSLHPCPVSPEYNNCIELPVHVAKISYRRSANLIATSCNFQWVSSVFHVLTNHKNSCMRFGRACKGKSYPICQYLWDMHQCHSHYIFLVQTLHISRILDILPELCAMT